MEGEEVTQKVSHSVSSSLSAMKQNKEQKMKHKNLQWKNKLPSRREQEQPAHEQGCAFVLPMLWMALKLMKGA